MKGLGTTNTAFSRAADRINSTSFQVGRSICDLGMNPLALRCPVHASSQHLLSSRYLALPTAEPRHTIRWLIDPCLQQSLEVLVPMPDGPRIPSHKITHRPGMGLWILAANPSSNPPSCNSATQDVFHFQHDSSTDQPPPAIPTTIH